MVTISAGSSWQPDAGSFVLLRCLHYEDFAAGQEFQLSRNDGKHNLHGGFANASYQIFDILSTEESDDFCAVTFYGTLEDGTDGFPCFGRTKKRHCL